MKTLKKTLFALIAVVTMTVIFCFGASAGTEGYYTFSTYNGYATITEVDNSISGNVSIPSYLGGCQVAVIGDGAFASCRNVYSVTIPNGVQRIGNSAFYFCDGLQSIRIPTSVYNIGNYAFNECRALESITLPDYVYICPGAFSNCWSLKSITIPYGTTCIENGTFKGSGLRSVSISSTVTSIGYGAFESCYLQSITIPSAVTEIDEYAFYECEYLDEVIIQNPDCSIYDDNGTICERATIVGHKGSTAESYAKDYDRYFESLCSYKTTTVKATLTKNGKIESRCDGCGYSKSTTIYSPKTFTLSTTKYTYDGKNKTPAVTVKDSTGKKLIKGTDYKLTVASKRSAIGRYTVKVTFMGNYSGTKYVYFYILPGKSASVKSSAQTSSAIKLTWSKVAGASGYTVYRYSPSKKAYVKAGATTGTSYTVKNLLAGTKYTFRVIAYGKTSSGKVYNSNTYALIKTATCTKTPTVKLASTAKGRATVAWTNVSGETGYQLYYATSKNGTYSKIANYKANTAKAYKTGLKSGRTYYFKVRTYINTDSGYVYSPFSAVKSVKIK